MVHVNVFCLCIYKYIAQECTFHQYASGGVFATILASRINYVCVCGGGIVCLVVMLLEFCSSI